MAKRVVGLLAAAVLVGGVVTYVYTHVEAEAVCEACHRAIHGETYYRVFLEGGETEHVCCPRCGLRFQQGRDDVVGADVSDFDTSARIDAEKAFYVEDSAVTMCRHDESVKEDDFGAQYELIWDRCLPSLVAFSTREAAEEFRKDSGGGIKTYAELLEEQY